ncbi:MAG TPA: tRNA pseudouridine(54/55) synthase Pus10 [Thermoplasmatales archaeon]|nr:tRNA pseudouridine(54/55) synthase Pus10 [Thermoplasmatales archaeon]
MNETTFFDAETLGFAEKILTKYRLCDSCLGRLFANVEKGMLNKERGVFLRKRLNKKNVSPKNCWLCKGLTEEVDGFAAVAEEKLRGYEFSSFLVGSKIDEEICEREQQLQETFHLLDAEPIRMEINREVGKILSRKTGKQVCFDHPEITILIDTRFNHVELQISSLFIYGRYMKKVRGIPQTRWPCRVCRGRGCRRCGFTGKTYETSVEELIAAKVLEATRGEDEAFHGCGREDIDALMLGEGRPFVLEIKNPRVRSLDLRVLEKKINEYAAGKVVVKNLRFTDKEEVKRIKSASFPKVYHVKVVAEKDIPEEKLNEVVHSLQGKIIQQLTPLRVAHRRSLKTREKKIYHCRILALDGKNVTLEIRAESGTYIKELVSGDDGRTEPSISGLLGIPCEVKELDVVAVEGE